MNKYSTSGLVATTPRHLVTQQGLPVTSFRLASNDRTFDERTQTLKDGDTNWFTVVAYRQLGISAAGSINKGDRVVVTGSLKVRDWDNGERTGTTVEIELDSIGHDLNYGKSAFTRTQLVPEIVKPQHTCNCGKCERRNN